MSIRDIIEAARRISTTAEEATDVGVPGWQDVLDDADTILAHGPELALMEAVCEAADALPCCDLGRDYPSGSCSGCSQKPVCNTTAALTAHREEMHDEQRTD